MATLWPWEISPFGGFDADNWWEPSPGRLKTAWSPSGEYLVFSSYKSLTGFDNTPADLACESKPACEELFLFDAEAAELICLSCDPGGARPARHTRLVERQEFQRFSPGPRSAPRVVLDSGQVFFETDTALTLRDVNGFQDVYEFHAGNFHLISSGAAQGGSAFVDASVDGRTVFFATPEALVRSDLDGVPNIYAARVDGGFAEPPLPPGPCAGEICRPPGSPPPAGALPGTSSFAGPGNVRPRPCKRGRVRRGNRCVKKKNHRHHKRGKHQQSHKGKGEN